MPIDYVKWYGQNPYKTLKKLERLLQKAKETYAEQLILHRLDPEANERPYQNTIHWYERHIDHLKSLIGVAEEITKWATKRPLE